MIFLYSIAAIFLIFFLSILCIALLYVTMTASWAALSSDSSAVSTVSLLSFFREVCVQFYVFVMMPIDHVKKNWGSRFGVEKKLLVLILPGYTDTDSLFIRIQMALTKQDIDYTTMRYKPFFGALESLSQKYAMDLKSSEYQKFVFVTHSMGGLLGERMGDLLENTGKEIGIIHLATPFEGTLTSFFAMRPCGLDMLPGSSFIQSLQWSSSTYRKCFRAEHDNVMIPRHTAILRDMKERQISVAAWRHNGLLFSKEVISSIIRDIHNFRQEGRFL